MDGGEATAKSSSFLLELGSAGEASVEKISMTSCSCTPCEAMLVRDAHTENCGISELSIKSCHSLTRFWLFSIWSSTIGPFGLWSLNPWLRILSGQRSVVCGSESSVVSGFCQWFFTGPHITWFWSHTKLVFLCALAYVSITKVNLLL